MSEQETLSFTGGCYCGELRYKASGTVLFKALCHCEYCQIFSGGMAALLIGMPADGFHYSQGEAKKSINQYSDSPSYRSFCPNCGTHIYAASDMSPGVVSIKVGTMDDRSLYGGPNMALQCHDRQPYHFVDPELPCHDQWPWTE